MRAFIACTPCTHSLHSPPPPLCTCDCLPARPQEETDELLLFDEELMEVDPEFLPRRLLTDFTIYNAEVSRWQQPDRRLPCNQALVSWGMAYAGSGFPAGLLGSSRVCFPVGLPCWAFLPHTHQLLCARRPPRAAPRCAHPVLSERALPRPPNLLMVYCRA